MVSRTWLKERGIFTPNANAQTTLELVKIFVQFQCLTSYDLFETTGFAWWSMLFVTFHLYGVRLLWQHKWFSVVTPSQRSYWIGLLFTNKTPASARNLCAGAGRRCDTTPLRVRSENLPLRSNFRVIDRKRLLRRLASRLYYAMKFETFSFLFPSWVLRPPLSSV